MGITTGDLYRRGKGRVIYWRRLEDGRQRNTSLKTANMREAERLRAAYITDYHERQPGTTAVDIPDLDPDGFWRVYEPWAEANKAPGTVRLERDTWESFLRYHRPARLSALDSRDAEGFKAWFKRNGYAGAEVSDATVNKALRTLKAIFNAGRKLGYLRGENPFVGVRMFRIPTTTPKFLSDDEVDRLLSAAAAHSIEMNMLFTLGLCAGLRRMEVAHCRWTWFDFDRKLITVQRGHGFEVKDRANRTMPMPSATARRLCPRGIFVKPRMEAYSEASQTVMSILHRYADLVEPVSIDEAYLDVTTNKVGLAYASQVARAIKDDIFQATHLTASAGVGPSKFIAKIASDMNKPDGLTVVQPDDIPGLLKDLPVRKVPGIGPATEECLLAMHVKTVGELRKWPQDQLVSVFGKAGLWFYALARGQDDREVQVTHLRKSIGAETTFDVDLSRLEDMRVELRKLAVDVEQRMQASDVRGRTITLKVTYGDFTKSTRSTSLDEFHRDAQTLGEVAQGLLDQTQARENPVRLLGISVSNLDNVEEEDDEKEERPRQLMFPFYTRYATP